MWNQVDVDPAGVPQRASQVVDEVRVARLALLLPRENGFSRLVRAALPQGRVVEPDDRFEVVIGLLDGFDNRLNGRFGLLPGRRGHRLAVQRHGHVFHVGVRLRVRRLPLGFVPLELPLRPDERRFRRQRDHLRRARVVRRNHRRSGEIQMIGAIDADALGLHRRHGFDRDDAPAVRAPWMIDAVLGRLPRELPL